MTQRNLTFKFVQDKIVGRFRDPAERDKYISWSLGDWANAMQGEAGELGNLIKKVRRGDFPLQDMRDEIGEEIADTILYLLVLAHICQVDVDTAIIDKFNADCVKRNQINHLISTIK
jgi:NTP pyrophosphatase (non-canonical NTP hydrolase)